MSKLIFNNSIYKDIVKVAIIATTSLAFLIGCTDKHKLKPADYVALAANVSGDICSSTGEDIEMPVKILFMVDVSGSNLGIPGTDVEVDGMTNRLKAYRELLESLIPTQQDYDPEHPSNYHFGLITFSSSAHTQTRVSGIPAFFGPKYRYDSQWNSIYSGRGIDTGEYSLIYGNGLTIYPSVFDAAREFVRTDIASTPPALVARSRYIMILISDGVPDDGRVQNNSGDSTYFQPLGPSNEQVCIPNPGLNGHTGYDRSYPYYCSGGYSNSPSGQTIQKRHFQTIDGRSYDLGKYGEYLFSQVYNKSKGAPSVYNTIQSTKGSDFLTAFISIDENDVVYRPLGVEWHTFYYNVESANNIDIRRQETAKQVLHDIATWGEGTFTDLTDPDNEFSFLGKIDFGAGARSYQLFGFFVHNRNKANFSDQGFAPDSDADGLYDDLEIQIGTNPEMADTDGDGISDGLEHFKTSNDPTVYDFDCGSNQQNAKIDEDHDGLNKCEETVILTSDKLFDTDSDGMPDGLEIRYGLNPKYKDRGDDYDFDGTTNFNEVTSHRNPLIPEADYEKNTSNQFSFSLRAYRDNVTKRNCYHIEMENLEIVQTKDNKNIIDLFSIQIPEDNPSEQGIFSFATITINFNDVKEGADNNHIEIEGIEFTEL
jgi:hypothetical protein